MEFDRDINDLAGFLTIERGLSGNSVAAYTSDLRDAAEFFVSVPHGTAALSVRYFAGLAGVLSALFGSGMVTLAP